MANPNKTVFRFGRVHEEAIRERESKPISAFVEWLAEQALQGVRFSTLEQAEQAYANAKSEKQS